MNGIFRGIGSCELLSNLYLRHIENNRAEVARLKDEL